MIQNPQNFPAPSAPDIIIDYQCYVIFLLSVAPQAKILRFLRRFTTDFALKTTFSKANALHNPPNFLRSRSQILRKQGGFKVRGALTSITVLSHLSRRRLKWFSRFSFRKSRLKWESTYVGEIVLVFLSTKLEFFIEKHKNPL